MPESAAQNVESDANRGPHARLGSGHRRIKIHEILWSRCTEAANGAVAVFRDTPAGRGPPGVETGELARFIARGFNCHHATSRGCGWHSPGGDLGDYRRSTLMSVIPQQAAATAWLAVGVSRVPTDEIANAIARCAGGVVHEVDVAITTSGSSQAFRSVELLC